MHIHIDFEEFLKFLKEENAEFVIIGGYAVAFHGYVRATKSAVCHSMKFGNIVFTGNMEQ
jgi:hypothetical protein